jgi:IS30 family transposase
MAQNQLNTRPRKQLGFKTLSEVFMQSLNHVALRAGIHHYSKKNYA